MKLVIAGYYGAGNIGDDAVLLGLLTGLGDLQVQVVIQSENPEFTHRNFGNSAIHRRDMNAFRREMQTADALVFGGGGILQDVTSIFSLKYYCNLITVAKKMGKKVFLLAQGVGPIESYFGKKLASAALKLCDAITVRDSKSQSVVRALGYDGRLEVTADLAWLVKPPQTSDAGFVLGDMKTVAISARPWGKGKLIPEAFGGFAQMLFKNGYVPVLVEMDRTMDTAILDTIAKMHGGRCPDVRNVTSPSDMLAKIGRMHAVVSMRLHAGIFAAASGIAPMMIAYDPKIASFATSLGLPSPMPVEALSAQRLWDNFQTFERRREEFNKQVAEKKDDQLALALKNIDVLRSAFPAVAR